MPLVNDDVISYLYIQYQRCLRKAGTFAMSAELVSLQKAEVCCSINTNPISGTTGIELCNSTNRCW